MKNSYSAGNRPLKNKPRIIILVDHIPPLYSGAGRRAYRHAKYLYDKGYLYKLIINCQYNKNNNLLPVNYIKQVFLPGWFKVKIINYLVFNVTILLFLIRSRRKYDIIHSFIDTYNSLGVILYSKISKKKIIVEFTLLPENDIKNKKRITRAIRRFVLNNCNNVICISQALANWCIKNQINTGNISVIPNDTEFENSTEVTPVLHKYINRYSHIILCAGPQTLRKGFDIAIETFKLLKQKLPGLGLLWLGPKNHSIKIHGHIRRIKDIIPDDFINVGIVENMDDYYNIADVTLFPSRREGFGNVIIESMACGTPVVASLLKGVTDTIISNEQDGILISSENPIDYAQAILKLLNDESLYDQIKRGGLRTIEKKFRTSVVMKSYFDIYSNLISS